MTSPSPACGSASTSTTWPRSRNARGGAHPDPVRAARLAVEAGADGITVHLREDRRHIRDADVERLLRRAARRR